MNSVKELPIHVPAAARAITYRTRGMMHGPITRLMSPGDLGQVLKPFVFLDLFDLDLHDPRNRMPIHPHSGLATMTVVVDGDFRFEDATDGTGHLSYGGFEWMSAGSGVWHGKELSGGMSQKARGFQLWIALPQDLELSPVDSQYVEAGHVPAAGPAHVMLGAYGGARSPARAPAGLTYLLVTLKAGECWTFVPPPKQSVAWLAVASGQLVDAAPVSAEEMVLFEPSQEPLTLRAGAHEDAVFVIGSAVPHPHELHLGNYSVHTSAETLALGEASIERLRKLLVEAGDRRAADGSVPIFRG